MSIVFTKATQTKSKGRILIRGPAKAGKSWSGMSILRGIVGPKGRIAAACTEHGGLVKTCASYFDFDVHQIEFGDPRFFIDMIEAAENANYDGLFIDGISAEWDGRGGALELVDSLTAGSQSRSSYSEGWKQVTPLHNAFIQKVLCSKIHIVATVRDKMKYRLAQNERGKMAPVKIGLRPIQRDQTPYEFDILCRVNEAHTFIIEGGRLRAMEGREVEAEPDAYPPDTKLIRLGEEIGQWLDSGVAVKKVNQERPEIVHLKSLFQQLGATHEAIRTALSRRGVAEIEQLTPGQAEEMISRLEAKINNDTFVASFPNTEPARAEAAEQERLYSERIAEHANGVAGEPIVAAVDTAIHATHATH